MCISVRFSNTKGNMFFGRNLDWEFGYGEGPVIAPRNWKRTLPVLRELWRGRCTASIAFPRSG